MDTKKNYSYVFDTNIILHHANSIFYYPKSEVIIPFCVINKLNDFQGGFTSLGKNVNHFLQKLEDLAKDKDISKGILLKNEARLFIYSTKDNKKLPTYFNEKKTSNQVLLACLNLKEEKNVCLISNSNSLRLKAKLLGILAKPFEETSHVAKNIYTSTQYLETSEEQLAELKKTDAIEIDLKDTFSNQYFYTKHQDKFYLLKYLIGWKRLLRVDKKKTIWNINPRNLEQAAAIDLLLDERVPIVFLAGKAGTGKTLLALAAAIEQLTKNIYKKILVSRPFVPMGRDMGFLPGTLMEKMIPWMQPLMDALEFIASYNSTGKKFNPKEMIDNNKIELEALTYIRGRSIPKRFILIDEAQNLTPHEIKTIITRVGEDSKIVFTGDPYQIDNPYVNTYSNGLTYAMEKFKSSELAGQIFLSKGERSQLAELASNLL